MQECPPWDRQCNLNRQCDSSDFVCLAMKDAELYCYLVGSYCRDPPACTQRGRLPSELLYPIFKACAEEAAGDPERFNNCILDMRDLINESLGHVREVLKK